MRTIKKYPNRRLYDSEISSYITLEDIRQLIIDGEEFEVVDAKSGNDLTRSVLLQIIAENEDAGQPIFSKTLLVLIIRLYGDSLQGVIGTYMEKSLNTFIEQQQTLRNQLGNIVGQSPLNVLNQITERNIELWKQLSSGLTDLIAPNTPRETRPHPPKPRVAKRRKV
jgi:polyhydroxyalkanoate synthesis repressor PhaR